jgi:hypothetical protein
MNLEIIIANSVPNIIKGVKSVSLMLEDGKVITLPLTPSLTLRAQENKRTVEQAINTIFANNKDYLEKAQLIAFVSDTLAKFNLESWQETSVSYSLNRYMTTYPKAGELRGWEIGQGLFLMCAWYQMPSGKYELTAYVS